MVTPFDEGMADYYGPAHVTAGDAVVAVLNLHEPRWFPIRDVPDVHRACVEDGQHWPCATVNAIDQVLGVARYGNGKLRKD
jgi:hypothetical protein